LIGGAKTDGADVKTDGESKKKYYEELYDAAGKAAIAIVDPPRSGCHRDLLDSLIQTAPEKIVYVSCDPATLSRDVKVLTEGGYRFAEATPVDMFPHTGHVETVCLLTHKD
jgi:23S rRNA (uracil1939-C5)-methyltransferase